MDTAGTTQLRDGKLTGRKVFVPMAAGADAFLVTVPGGLALVDRDAPGLHLTVEQTQDGGHFGTLTLDGAPAEAIPGDAAEALDEAALATAAYLLGAMDRAFAMTLDYLKTRQQFGKLIGSFQALQHRAVDLQIQVALTRASVEAAAATLDGGAPPALRQAVVSRAKARASEAAMLVTKQCIQLHGGIGYTDAYDVGLFLRKAMVLSSLYGPAALAPRALRRGLARGRGGMSAMTVITERRAGRPQPARRRQLPPGGAPLGGGELSAGHPQPAEAAALGREQALVHEAGREGLAVPVLAARIRRHGAVGRQADHHDRGVRAPRLRAHRTTTASSWSARC